MIKYTLLFFVAFGIAGTIQAQENSPLSRYGIGDLVPNQNIISRAMGGIAAGLADTLYGKRSSNNKNGINFVNPASLANLGSTIFDIGGEVDIRTIKSVVPPKKFTSVNTLISYLQLAFPISSEKMKRKNIGWGMSIGLRPVSRINYKIEKNEHLPFPVNDSLNTLYEGDGGMNQAFIGTGIKVKQFSFGINAGYSFGTRSYNSRLTFINDTVTYYRSHGGNKTTFGGLFLSGGAQYDIAMRKGALLRIGVYGTLQQTLKAKRDDVVETFTSDDNGATYRVDSIYEKGAVSGTIKLPSTLGLGFTYQNEHWMLGADLEMSNWSKYRYYGASDNTQNSFTIRAGTEYYPADPSTTSVKKYFKFVRYRAGFYYGSNYIGLTTNKPEYGITLGTGMPLTSLNRINYDGNNGSVMLNTAVELGNPGSKATDLRENVLRFSIGISMTANWFIKRKYN